MKNNNQLPIVVLVILVIAFVISQIEVKPVVSSSDLSLKKAQICHEIGLKEVEEKVLLPEPEPTLAPQIIYELKKEPIIEQINGICYEIDSEGVMTPCEK